MGSDSDGALRALREAEEFAKSYRFELSDDYLALIDAVEAMPRNQSGSDKTGRWLGRRAPAAAPVTKGASSRSGQ